eukprot:CAMPEP_0182908096 /NCGR_PEP_ID=MMETSP0034_2-20130328/34994_1 /TAXON_ID=156128 /ORGANISM="Nephroselmis pyriformis, Strain CCMP717" /LENGTH=60 /DNA_ID=CAMNT_0025044215 /DNA_START=197 /DNA_END=376 /DNA_ORIENTATION=-
MSILTTALKARPDTAPRLASRWSRTLNPKPLASLPGGAAQRAGRRLEGDREEMITSGGGG